MSDNNNDLQHIWASTATENENIFLVISLRGEPYAIPTTQFSSVVCQKNLRIFPLKSEHLDAFKGFFVEGGKPTLLLSMHNLLGLEMLPEEERDLSREAAVICDVDDVRYGLLVDSCFGLEKLRTEQSNCVPLNEEEGRGFEEYFDVALHWHDHILISLSLEKVLSKERNNQINKVAKELAPIAKKIEAFIAIEDNLKKEPSADGYFMLAEDYRTLGPAFASETSRLLQMTEIVMDKMESGNTPLLSGKINPIIMTEILQVLSCLKSTGMLFVDSDDEIFTLYVSEGELINAEGGGHEPGLTSFRQASRLKSGHYRFVEGDLMETDRRIELSTVKLIAEIIDHVDIDSFRIKV